MASETELCNQALGRIGALQIDNFDTDPSVQAVQCRLHYAQARDALLRSHWWRFASARVALTESSTAPDFEWDNQFALPDDLLAFKSVFEDNNTPNRNTRRSYALEGNLLLTNEDEAEIRYVKQVTDVALFDSLFTEVLVLQLALKLIMPLAQDKVARRDLQDELLVLMSRVRTMDRQEANTQGRNDIDAWIDARLISQGRIPSRLGS